MIAPSFADIFYNNCFKNGILPIALPQEEVDKLMDDAERGANAIVTIDLENQVITGPDGGSIAFEVDAFRKHCLLNGLDDIGLTMEKAERHRRLRGQACRPPSPGRPPDFALGPGDDRCTGQPVRPGFPRREVAARRSTRASARRAQLDPARGPVDQPIVAVSRTALACRGPVDAPRRKGQRARGW